MCIQYTYWYKCGHSYLYLQRCGKSLKDELKAQKATYCLGLRALFGRPHSTGDRTKSRPILCPNCEWKMKREIQYPVDMSAGAPRGENLISARELARRGRSFRGTNFNRWEYLCECCAVEGRDPSERIHSANGGLCCARGLEEWEARAPPAQCISEARHARDGPPIPRKVVPSVSRKVAPPVPAKDTRVRPSQSVLKARAAASEAAREYGWKDSESTLVDDEAWAPVPEPHVHFGTPGPASAVARGQGGKKHHGLSTKEIMTREVDPGIDWKRWDASPQTGHGRIPAPPDRPLPTRPLNTKGKAKSPLRNVTSADPSSTDSSRGVFRQRKASRPAVQPRIDTVPALLRVNVDPIQWKDISFKGSRTNLLPRPGSPVSPMSTAWRDSWGKVSISDIEDNVEKAIGSWSRGF